MYDAVALGELLVDFTYTGTNEDGYPIMSAHPGGAPANYLAAMSSFGAATAFIGKVGADSLGSMLKRTLEMRGIDTKNVIEDECEFTTLAFVTLDNTGNRMFSFSRKPGADTRLHPSELNTNVLNDAKVFHFGSLSLTDQPARNATCTAVTIAKNAKSLISFDPNLRKPLWRNLNEAKEQMLWGLSQSDIIKISDEEAEFLFGISDETAIEHIFSSFDAKLVMLTCGEKGCFISNRRHLRRLATLGGGRIIDTTGAGDIFGGSAMFKILDQENDPSELSAAQLLDIAMFATAAAGISATRRGGISSVPCMKEVLSSMHNVPVLI